MRLTPGVSYFTVNNFLLIKNNNRLFKINKNGDARIPELFDFLREPKKLIEIIDFLSDFKSKDVLSCIETLYKLELLKIEKVYENEHQDSSMNKHYTSGILSRSKNFVGQRSFAYDSYYKRLTNSRILLIGDGVLANKLFSYLEKIGIGSISSSIADHSFEQSSHPINKYDLIVAAEDYPNLILFETLNKLCFEKRRPWLRLSFDDLIGYVGPLVIPGNTSCYNCCRLRQVSNSPNYEYQLWRYRDCIPKTGLMVSEVFADIVCTVGADEIIRYLSNYQQPLTMNSVAELDTRQMQISHHKIITHPYCINCNQFMAKKKPKLDRVIRPPLIKIVTGKTRAKNSDLYISSLSCINDINNGNDLLHGLRELKDDKTGIVLTSKKIFYVNQLGITAHHFFRTICSSVPRIGLKEDIEPATPAYEDHELIYYNSGSGFSPADAELRALMESVERYAINMVDESRFHWAPYNEVKKTAINPIDFILYNRELYVKHGFRCSQFSPDITIPWIDGYDTFSGKSILIPADFVYPPIRRKPLVLETSNGAAAHADKVLAILNGLFEVIERDALLIMWLNKLSMPILNVKSLPLGFKESIKSINNFGMEIKLVDLTNDTQVPTIMAACYNKSADKYPSLVIGTGCHIDPEKALQKALFEMEISLLDIFEKPMKKNIGVKQIAKPYDHKLFYLNPKMRKYWNFMLSSKKKKYTLPNRIGSSGKYNSNYNLLMRVVRNLHTMNYRVLFIDITPTDIKRIGLSVVKVLIPGFQPLFFGNNLRLSSQRLRTVSIRLGYNRRSTDHMSELNLAPHPLP
jgi:ribosomal protein S12 methylthiotransferase accessory factor